MSSSTRRRGALVAVLALGALAFLTTAPASAQSEPSEEEEEVEECSPNIQLPEECFDPCVQPVSAVFLQASDDDPCTSTTYPTTPDVPRDPDVPADEIPTTTQPAPDPEPEPDPEPVVESLEEEAPAVLPRTGASVGILTLGALGLLGAGLAMRRGGRHTDS